MKNAPAILKSLVVYALCVPLAVIIGYLLSDPMDYSTLGVFGIVLLVLISPLLLRWHYPLMLLSLNLGGFVFFLKGRPDFWLVMVALSLGISVVERAINSEMHFIRVPQITWPLICMIAVVFVTAKLTGGFGLRSFGSDVMGGKKYIWLVMGILGYFALTARRIPPERAGLYFGLFILSGIAGAIGDFYPITPSFLHFIYWIFPPSAYSGGRFDIGTTRLVGIGSTASALLYWFVGRNGLRGIFLSGKWWRPAVFFGLSFVSLVGGYRGVLLTWLFIMGTLFFLEKMHRTWFMPVLVLAGIVLAAIVIPFASHLPFTIQRALSVLPLNVSYEARESAEASSRWRVDMWKALLPQVPQYLLLGKGYALTQEDSELMGRDSAFRSVDASQQGLAISGDYHNGPLSVVIPFGIWGCIVVLWFMAAGLRVMYCNFRHGDESLRNINAFLFASFVYRVLEFYFVFGGINTGMILFDSLIGLSVALNGGVCRPAPQPVQARQPMVHPARILPRARPAFQR